MYNAIVWVNSWWQQNGGIVEHLLSGGSFQNNSAVSLKRFQNTYRKDAIYEDLFVVAKGRNALRQSFALIGSFWEIQLISVGPPTLVVTNTDTNTTTKSTTTSSLLESYTSQRLLRVPYVIQQRPKYLPIVPWYSYQGWINLTLVLDDNSFSNESKNKTTSSWKIRHHDDRVAVTSWMTQHSDHYNGNDVLTLVRSIPILGSIFQSFRLQHGYVVEYFAQQKYQQSGK